MGTASTYIRLRESNANTVANVIETANAMWQALEGAGMVRVSNTDYAGQAGRLVSGSPGTGETQVTALGTTSGNGPTYYNVYRHPTLNFYLRVNAIDAGFSGSTSRWVYFTYGLFFDLDGAGSHVPGGLTTYAPQSWDSGTSVAVTNNAGLPNAYKNTYVSVGDDHLCISSEPINYPTPQATYVSFYYAPGKSVFGFSVFADTDGAGSLVVVMPAHSHNQGSDSFSWGFNNSSAYNNAFMYTAIRYWTYEPGVKVPVFRGGAAAGFIIDPATPSTSVGTRVQQAQLYIGGPLRKFNFGFVAEAAVTDSAVITLNLSGAGSQKYRVAKGFGPANPGISGGPTVSNYDTTSNSCIILPWNAP